MRATLPKSICEGRHLPPIVLGSLGFGLVWFGLVGFSFNASLGPKRRAGHQEAAYQVAWARSPGNLSNSLQLVDAMISPSHRICPIRAAPSQNFRRAPSRIVVTRHT